MIERKIEKSCKAWARRRRWWVRKFTSPAQRAVPDDLFAKRGRKINGRRRKAKVAVEFKATGKEPTALQRDEHKQMREAGWDVRWYDSIEAFKADFEKLDAWLNGDEAPKRNKLEDKGRKKEKDPAVRSVEKPTRSHKRKASRRKRSTALERTPDWLQELA